MPDVLKKLVELLDVKVDGDDRFLGDSQDLGFAKLFGGQVIGQSLSSASKTVLNRMPNSLHAYFLRPGDAGSPVNYRVERVRDGRSFSVRRVLASQFDKPILTLTVSFQASEVGMEHQVPMPVVPMPESLKPDLTYYREHAAEIPERVREQLTGDKPIDIRTVEAQNPFRPRPGMAQRHMWIRAVSRLPDDVAVHQSMLGYVSDFGFLETSLMPHGLSIAQPNLQIASLDHTVWFHKPFRLDDWLLYAIESPNASGGRGLVRGHIYTRQGELVASTAQEGLIRLVKEK